MIDFLRGHSEAQNFLTKINQPPLISTITTAELYSGVKNKDEEDLLKNLIEHFHVIPVSNSIAKKGGLIKKEYAKSHDIGIADAVIAATVEEKKAFLATLNLKHFPMVENKYAPY